MSSPLPVVHPAGDVGDGHDRQPASCRNCAASPPTLPKPCTATVAPRGSTPASRSALNAAYITPRLVAPPRPSDPPTETGLPVTTPVTV